jgi:hypothetical protein
VLDDVEYEDSEPPAIGLVRAAVPWDDVRDHIKIAHHPILVLPEGSSQYAGAYWTGTQMAVTDDLGSDQEPMPLSLSWSCLPAARNISIRVPSSNKSVSLLSLW